MKKLILAAITTACAASVFAQGTVIFNNAVSGTLSTRVFGPDPANPNRSVVGNRSSDLPVGSTDYAGLTLIGTTGGLPGASVFTQLLGAPGFGAAESSLQPAVNAATTFRSGTGSGVFLAQTVTFSNILPDSPQATLEMVAWNNASGLYPTWAQAQVAWKAGLIAAGTSGTWNSSVGGNLPAPYLISNTDPSQHVQSFNLYFVPEPTSAALLGLGAAAMLIFRRRK
jgi:hypothetical protein